MKLTVKIDHTFEAETAEELFNMAGTIIGTELVKSFGVKGRDYEKNLAHLNKVNEGTLVITNNVD
ncbi:hypothetical protein [Streptomyces sp. NPDC059513]|uniref:hypothetical protein n=1 Tax=unclassified Streptomyces TaxID=2593676 RepID=UPI00369B6746